MFNLATALLAWSMFILASVLNPPPDAGTPPAPTCEEQLKTAQHRLQSIEAEVRGFRAIAKQCKKK